MRVSKLKIGIGLVLTYVSLTAISILLLWVAYSIPRTRLYPQIAASNAIIQDEGKYPSVPFFKGKVRDNYSDACMLNVAFCANDDEGWGNLKNAMRANEPVEGDELDGLKAAVESYPQIPDCFSYGRYWHGYQIYLRPLLSIFDLSQIRIINYILLFGIACLTIFLWWRRFGVWYAVLFIIALLSVSFPIVPKCLHFSAIFYVGLISIILLIVSEKTKANTLVRPILFFASGAITSCLDLLTAPMVPLVLILLTDSMMQSYTGTQTQQFYNRLKDMISLGILWCIGYALFWATKFAVGSLILGTNLFVDGISQAATRMDASSASFFTWFSKVILLPVKHNYVLTLCALALAYILVRWKKYQYAIVNNLWLVIIAMIEPMWLFLLREHTVIHYNIFVWRSEIILVLCLSVFIYRVITQTKEHERTIQ